MLGHQFGQNLVLGLDLLLQLGDPLLLGRMVWPCFRLKCSRAFLEELLLPAVEDRGLESVCNTAPKSAPAPADASSGCRLSLSVFSASVAASYVRSIILTGERFHHFQLNRNTFAILPGCRVFIQHREFHGFGRQKKADPNRPVNEFEMEVIL